jgi:hypothetical protein
MIPVLPTHEVATPLLGWPQACGFSEVFRHGDLPTYAGLVRGHVRLHLDRVEDDEIARTSANRRCSGSSCQGSTRSMRSTIAKVEPPAPGGERRRIASSVRARRLPDHQYIESLEGTYSYG